MNDAIRGALALAAVLTLATGACHAADDDEDNGGTPLPAKHAALPASGSNGVVVLSAEAIAANHIQCAAVRRGSAYVTTRVPGRVEFDPNATAEVHVALEGRLLDWKVNLGDTVRKGDDLARLDTPQSLGAPSAIKAPIAGEIVERAPSVGAWVQPADKLAVIIDRSAMLAVARVREDLVGRILTNAPATFRVLAFPDGTFTGRFLRINASVEPETRTVDFWYAVPDAGRQLRAGMFATALLATDRVEDALLLPEEAVQTVHDRSVVFVEEQPGRYRMTPVRLGRAAGDAWEVIEGPASGTRVVAAGSFILKSEALRAELTGDTD